MIDRSHIEQLLKINGLSPTSPDEEIRSVLISARWHKEDVETAITVLRENTTTHASRVDTLHDVFLTDRRLSPQAIHDLLGIDTSMEGNELEELKSRRHSAYIWQIISIVLFALLIAAGTLLTLMYTEKVGVFYDGEQYREVIE